MQIRLMGDDCGCIAWGALAIEPCAEEEFVPEPGSLVLLGGGLMGLAGYATGAGEHRVNKPLHGV